MRVYVAGKISGDSGYKAKFKKAEKLLEDQGYIVYNPAELVPVDLEYEEQMRECFCNLDCADGIYLLKDWIDSPGAQREKAYAEALGLWIKYEDKGVR